MTEDRFRWNTAAHRDWMLGDARRQFAFFAPSLNPSGGFDYLDDDGRPLPGQPRELHATGRMVHAFALGHAAGLVSDGRVVDHGLQTLWRHHRDAGQGGYLWSFDASGQVVRGDKLAYGHAFVLLAAASAKLIGHPDADRLLDDIRQVIEDRFWDPDHRRMREEYARDWSEISDYRGMNANMHSVEAFLVAYEATEDRLFLDRALDMIRFFIGKMALAHQWRVPEHYDLSWQVDADYEGDPMFRPAGRTPGHWFEWARLCLQAWDLDGRRDPAIRDWARALCDRADRDGWCGADGGGLLYTVDADGRPLRENRYWWPVAEAIAAIATLQKLGEDHGEAYARYLRCAEAKFIDPDRGGWYPDADRQGTQFTGKPDIYHAVQAVLYPLSPAVSRLSDALAADLAQGAGR